jgi:aspartate aminotransferase
MKLSPEVTDSLTLKFAQIAREKNQAGERIISLGLGEPGFSTPESIVKATIEALKNGHTRYSHPKGLFELRQLIANKMRSENAIETTPENIIVTPGAKQASMIALMAILEPHDEVINFTPCFVSYIPQIKIAEPESKIHNIDVNRDDFSIDWDRVREKVNSKTKVIILNSPNNPTGKMLTHDDMLQLISIIHEYKCFVLSDEIYEKLVFGSIKHISPGSFREIQDRVITVNGFSKSFAMTGWRIGYVNADAGTIKKMDKLQQHLNTNTATFIQKGACEAFKIDDGYWDQHNADLNKKALYLEKTLAQNLNVNIVPPEGGLFAFLNIIGTGLNSDSFATKLLEAKSVAVTPGIAFGADWDDHVRISMAIDYDEFVEGINLIKEFSKEMQV